LVVHHGSKMPLHPDRHVTPGGRPIRRVAVAAGGADRPGHPLGPKPNLRGWGGGGQFQRPAGVNKWPVSSRGAPLVYVSSLEELGEGIYQHPQLVGFSACSHLVAFDRNPKKSYRSGSNSLDRITTRMGFFFLDPTPSSFSNPSLTSETPPRRPKRAPKRTPRPRLDRPPF